MTSTTSTTSTTAPSAGPRPSAGPSPVRLALLHARYGLIETFRIPIAIIGTMVFPALALLFFVVPQREVADNPLFATQAVISLAVFAVMANSLFSFGISIAEDREKPWDPYLRTLPAPGGARVLAHILSTGMLGLASIVPVVVVGAVFTAADASLLGIVGGLVAISVSSLPFMLIGIAIGYSMPSKAAIAVVQVIMFGFAFAGGLFLPPLMFPHWLETLSTFFPSRQARELVIWAATGEALPAWSWLGLAAWIAGTIALALWLFRRDQGRRFR
ncbi:MULTISPECIES: ABC transporter permease [unclassified Pseudactinotalea]|uniref:ABC transporter permease n=1 Tax=unclassified Pseudactinotalea TaxID=2649176 RepID=UPI00128DA565|nr:MULTISPECIES: ABC transporter permease [unclassified Pseudactinotalea]MPV48592.1 ABC transporter permease [Pseudactinotalea sp. HY160]QGH68570.1 ABC transporter permease [Pseudactinotalea sp. HY158]